MNIFSLKTLIIVFKNSIEIKRLKEYNFKTLISLEEKMNRLKTVSKEQLIRQRNALLELLVIYEEKKIVNYCPLCRASYHICKNCCWKWIIGQYCSSWNNKRGYFTSSYRKIQFERQRLLRIKQIKRWIIIINKELEERND